MYLDPGKTDSSKPAATESSTINSKTIDRRKFIAAAGAGISSLGAFRLPAHAAEQSPDLKFLALPTRRSMAYRMLGAGEKKLILIHGFPGSSRQFVTFNSFLHEHGIAALAPNLYGTGTDWNKRAAVMDAGRDIAALSQTLHGPQAKPVILCVSAGAKDGLATAAAFNRKNPHNKVSALYVVSGQMDLGRRDTFSLLPRDKQFELNSLRGVRKQAFVPLFQPLRNLGSNIKQNIAHRRLEELARNPQAAYQRIIQQMSPTEDWPVLKADPEFNQAVYEDIASYSADELLDSIYRLFDWKIDFNALQGTKVHIIHGTEDTMVAPENAHNLQRQLMRHGVETSLRWYPDGHLLLKKRAAEIGSMILREY